MEDYDESCMDENDVLEEGVAPSVDAKVSQRWRRPDVEKFDPKLTGIPSLLFTFTFIFTNTLISTFQPLYPII
jgi:hypothetical protein